MRLQPPGQHGPLHRSGNPPPLPGRLADHPRQRGVRPPPFAGEGRLGLRRTQGAAPACREGRHRPARYPGIDVRGDRPVPVHALQRHLLRRGRRSGRPHRSLRHTRRPPQHRQLSPRTRLAAKDLDREGQHRVIFDYNHSTVYANTVLAVAEKIRRPEPSCDPSG